VDETQNLDSNNSVRFDDLSFSFSVLSSCDFDNDGIINSKDLDADNDGIPDNVEAQTTAGYIPPVIDNAATYITNSGINSAYTGGLTPVETTLGTFDFFNLDSDGDGLTDLAESGLGNTEDLATPGQVDITSVGNNGLVDDNETLDDYSDVNGDVDDPANDLEEDDFTTSDVDYRSLADVTAPAIAVTVDDSNLISGETATVTFTLSEDSTDFIVSDITVVGGTLSNFTGSGSIYTATFTPDANSTAAASVSVGNATFSDAAGNSNTDGADTNNSVSIAVDTIVPLAPTVTISEDADNDELINEDELSGDVDVTVGVPAGVVAGDTVTVTDGTTFVNVVLTADQAAGTKMNLQAMWM